MQPTAGAHLVRVHAHIDSANRMRAEGDEWAAVAYFYAAFHAARAALIEDPRLDSDVVARAVDSRLSASSRHVDYHTGGRARPPGLNEVVRFLYRGIGAEYNLLHVKSVEVRYQSGLIGVTLDQVAGLASRVIDHWEGLGLIADDPA